MSSTLLADPPSNETIDVFCIKIRTLKCHNENNFCVFFPFLSLCVRVTFFGHRRFRAALHRREEFQLEFLGLLWNTYLVIWSISGLELDRNIHLTALSDETVHELIVLLCHWGKFLWRQTAWSSRQASVSRLEFYRNMCVHCTSASNTSGKFALMLQILLSHFMFG